MWNRPYRYILVKFDLPSGSDSGPLTANVEYIVNSRTSAGRHSFWMDIYGELVDADGIKFQDMDQTGTAQWIVRGIVAGFGPLMNPLLLLILLAVLSCAFTMVIL